MIPKDAIQAASKAMYAHRESDAELNGAILISPPADEYECCAQAALEAAAPYLRAQALEDAAKYVEDCIKAGADDSISPDATRNWLRARAATERGEG